MIRPRRIPFQRDDVTLVAREWGSAGPAVLFLHGLAGWWGEWRESAAYLVRDHRVLAFDARGHGESEQRPDDVSRAAHLADAAEAIERFDLAPCAVIGQSLGGVTALLLAANRPDLVRSLVIVEAMPATPDTATIEKVICSLAEWPVPFATHRAALDFFFGRGLDPAIWAGGLERRPGGWWPRFDLEVMERTLVEAPPKTYWDEWERIRRPTLVVRGENGDLALDVAARMAARRTARLVTVPAAGHDVHLERPDAWQAILSTL